MSPGATGFLDKKAIQLPPTEGGETSIQEKFSTVGSGETDAVNTMGPPLEHGVETSRSENLEGVFEESITANLLPRKKRAVHDHHADPLSGQFQSSHAASRPGSHHKNVGS